MDRFADIVLTPIALFSGRPLAVTLALSILAAALGLWAFFLLPTERRFIGRLRRLAHEVRAAGKVESDAAARFEHIDLIFARSDLAPAWRRYRSGVEFENGEAWSYADPADFFALPHLPGHSYPKWSNTLAGVFLTVGLFFTFVGLSAALLQLGGNGHGALDPAQLKVAVQGILAVSSVKFITSIAGILAYIFWTVVARQQMATQAQAEEEFLAEIRALSTYVAPEMLLRRHLRLAETQKEQFGELAESLAARFDAALTALPCALAENVGAATAEAFAPLRDDIAAMSARVGEANKQTAESAGEVFGALWREGAGGHLEKFGVQMSSVLAALEGVSGKIRSAESDFGGEIGRGAEELTASSRRMIAAIEQGQANLAGSLAAFDQKIAALPATYAAIAAQSTQDMGASMRQVLDGVAQRAEEAGRAGADTLAARTAEMSAALATAAATMNRAGADSQAQMADGARKISEATEQSGARLTQILDSFAAAVNRLTSRLDQTEQTLEGQNNRLSQAGEIVARASDDLAQAAGALEGAAAPLTGATLAFRDAMIRFAEGTDKIGLVATSGDAIAAHIAAFGAQMNQSLAAFDALPEKIRAVESGFGGEIGRSTQDLTVAALRMSEGFERSQSALAATLGAFESRIESIPSSLVAASESTAEAIGAKIRQTLDQTAALAEAASRNGADLFGARVEDIARMLDAAAARLQEASHSSGDHLRAGRESLAEGVAAGVKIVADTAENSAALLARTVETFAAAVRGLSARLGETVAGLDAQNARMETAGALVSGASRSLADAAGTVAVAATPLAGASQALRGAMTTFSGAAEQIRALENSGRIVVENFGKAAASAQETFGAQAENFRLVERAVAQTLQELTCGVQALGQEISHCIETYDNEIARSIGSLETALIDIGDIVDARQARRTAEAR